MSNTQKATGTGPKRNKPFDLDALDREDRPEPFVAVIGGEEYTFGDPAEMEWDELFDLHQNQDERGMAKALLGDQYPAFQKNKLPVWKYRTLIAAWDEHYGFSKMMGEAPASSSS